MILRTIKQIAIGIFCVGVMVLSSLSLFPSGAIALPQATTLAAMEDTADEVADEVQDTVKETKEAIEEGVEEAGETAKEMQETVQSETEETADKTPVGTEEDSENIVDKVKKLFSGE